MTINELTEGIIYKIKNLYPEIDTEELGRKVSALKIVETDVGEKSPIVFEQNNGILRLNSQELEGDYDLEYYMTVFLLLMTKEYEPALHGLRTGYYSGVANNLVGNFVNDDGTEVKPGIDMFESLRGGIADLSSKVGADRACTLCEAPSLADFIGLASEFGIENPEQFLAPYNYLAVNAANLNENQERGLVGDITKNNMSLAVQPNAKTF